jgi:hypothetical protein
VIPHGLSRLVTGLAIVATIVFSGVVLTELNYAGAHPYAYGPAKVIAWAAAAGVVLSVAVALLARALTQRP